MLIKIHGPPSPKICTLSRFEELWPIKIYQSPWHVISGFWFLPQFVPLFLFLEFDKAGIKYCYKLIRLSIFDQSIPTFSELEATYHPPQVNVHNILLMLITLSISVFNFISPCITWGRSVKIYTEKKERFKCSYPHFGIKVML